MLVNVNEINISKEELESIDRSNPYNVVASFIRVISDYNKDNTDSFYEKLQYLMGSNQPLSELAKQQIKDRMLQNDKYSYIGKSYFVSSTPDNNYTPQEPYRIEITENDYSSIEEGYKKLFVKSGGADSLRGITLRLAKDNNYYIWSDSYMGLLSDIRKKEEDNSWI